LVICLSSIEAARGHHRLFWAGRQLKKRFSAKPSHTHLQEQHDEQEEQSVG